MGKEGEEVTEETKLTPTERGAYAMEMANHRRMRCSRCEYRVDLAHGGYVCDKGEDSEVAMLDSWPCKKFRLNEDQEAWLE